MLYLNLKLQQFCLIKVELLKQGPSPDEDESAKEESVNWKVTHRLRTEPMDLSHFQAGMDKRQVNNEFTARNLILLRYYECGYNMVFGKKLICKLCPNPVTEIILKEEDITSDEQLAQMTKDYFAYESSEKLTIFERNLLD